MADSAAQLAKLGLDMAAYAASDPRGAAQGVADGARSLYDQHQAAREQAKQNGTLAEFDARFAGRLAGEGVLAFLPLGTIAKAGKATRFGRGAEHFKEAADQSSSPALRGNPYHPEAVEARIGKPKYRTNQAHNTFSPRYNPKKTPEPRDAAEVYSRSVQGKTGTWYGRSLESGEYYQFRIDRVDSAHFTKIVTEDSVPEKARILLNQAKQ